MSKLVRAKKCVGKITEMDCGTRYKITGVLVIDSEGFPPGAVVMSRSPKKNALVFSVTPVPKQGHKISPLLGEKLKSNKLFIAVPSRLRSMKFVPPSNKPTSGIATYNAG